MLSFYLKNNELLNLCIASSLVLCKNNTMESLCNRFNTPYSNMRRSLANLSSLINELDDQTTIEKIHKEYVITTQKQTDPLFICDKIHNYYLEHSIKFQLVQAIICDEITHEFRLCEHLNISTTYLAALLKKINNHLSKFKVKLEKHNRNIRLGGSYQNTVFYIYQFQYKFPSRSLIERYQKYKPYKKELNFKKNMNFFLLNNIKYSSLITKKIPLFSKEEINQLDQLLNSYFSYSFEDKNINANKFLNLLYLLTSPFDEEKFNANNFLNSISYTNTSKSMFSYELLSELSNYFEPYVMDSTYLSDNIEIYTYFLSIRITLSTLLKYDFNLLFNYVCTEISEELNSPNKYQRDIDTFLTCDKTKQIFSDFSITQSEYIFYISSIREICYTLLKTDIKAKVSIYLHFHSNDHQKFLIKRRLTNIFNKNMIDFVSLPSEADLIIVNEYLNTNFSKNIFYLNDITSKQTIKKLTTLVSNIYIDKIF